MAKPEDNELVKVVSRNVMYGKKWVRINWVHQDAAIISPYDVFGPIPYCLLKRKGANLCVTCFPPSG